MNKGKRCLLVIVCLGLLLGGKTVTAAGYLHWEQQVAFLALQLPKPNKARAVEPTNLAETTQSNDEITVQSDPGLTGPQTNQTMESVSESGAAAVTKESTEPESVAETVAESERDGETDEETTTSGEASLGDLQ